MALALNPAESTSVYAVDLLTAQLLKHIRNNFLSALSSSQYEEIDLVCSSNNNKVATVFCRNNPSFPRRLAVTNINRFILIVV